MSALIKFDPKKLASALKRTAREAAPVAAFLKMDKTGQWVFGANAEEVSEDDKFIVNPEGFQHGYVAWTKGGGDKLGEVMVPVTDPMPEVGEVPSGAGGWEAQLGCHLKRADGEGSDLIYRSSSVGGKRAIAQLAESVGDKVAEDSDAVFPIITLDSEDYKHAKYGKIYNPIISIVKWVKAPTVAAAPKKAAPKKLSNKKK